MNQYKFISLSAKPVDVSKYTWVKYKGPKSLYYEGKNRYHDLTIRKGDIIGYRKVRTGNRFYVVTKEAQGVVHKLSGPELDSINKHATPVGDHIEQQEGSSTRVHSRKRKNASERFKPKSEPTRERDIIDMKNYLWYKFKESRSEPIFSKIGDITITLTKGLLYGLRIVSPKRGGYVCLEDGTRIRISTEKYDKLVQKGIELSTQPKGTIVPAKNIKLTVSDTEKALQKAFAPNREYDDTPEPVRKNRSRTITYRDSDGTTTSDTQELKKILRSDGIQEDTLDDIVSDSDLNVNIEGEDDPVVDSEEDNTEYLTDTDTDNVNYSDIVDSKDVDTYIDTDDSELYETPEVSVPDRKDVFDTGYVVHFKRDTLPKRKYLIVDKYPYPENDKLTSYILYDITNKPKYTQTIRLKANQKEHDLSRYTTYSKFDESWNSRILKLLQLPESEEPVYE